MGIVDAGTVEAVRAMGAEVVSSADLVQHAVARWSAQAVALHARASAEVAGVKDEAFALIGARHRGGQGVAEHEVAGFIRERFAALGLEWPDGPIVAANEHAADPHYEPSAATPTPIEPGDWVLIDLWARRPGDENIYSDITWVGFCAHGGRALPALHTKVFDAVKAARDAALTLARQAHAARRAPAGWELDEAARQTIIAAGYERGLRHRTGHSLSPGRMVHGVGANLDNSETRDTRLLLPGLGYTIEPGIYLPTERVGVRLEINVYTDAARGPVVTSCVQDRPVMV
jgi:Xaa-Pro aminopeptidase